MIRRVITYRSGSADDSHLLFEIFEAAFQAAFEAAFEAAFDDLGVRMQTSANA
jgi:hypothetical protein